MGKREKGILMLRSLQVITALMAFLLFLSGCGVIQKEEEIRIMRYGERAVWEDVEIAVVLKGNLVSENNIFVYCERKNASSLSFGVSGVRYLQYLNLTRNAPYLSGFYLSCKTAGKFLPFPQGECPARDPLQK